MDHEHDLAKWLAGEMTPAEEAAFQQSEDYKTYARIRDVSARLEAPAVDADAMFAKIRHAHQSPKVIPLYRRTAFKVAAMLVVLLAIGYLMFKPEFVDQHTNAGQTLAFSLPDQSEVKLNGNSKVSYRSDNWDDTRLLSLEGEAYFKVAKGKTFTVKTKLGDVTVVGTQFNVRAHNGLFNITCYEGKVRVIQNGNPTLLTAGMQTSFRDGQQINLPQTDQTEPEWLHGEMRFVNESLQNILKDLEASYQVKITLRAGEKTERFTGTLPMQNLDEALEKLGLLYQLKVDKKGKEIILKADDQL